MMAVTSANYWSAEVSPLAALIVDYIQISFPTFGCILFVGYCNKETFKRWKVFGTNFIFDVGSSTDWKSRDCISRKRTDSMAGC